MKKIIYISVIISVLGFFLFMANHSSTPAAVAAYKESHAGHDHEESDNGLHRDNLGSLFTEDKHEEEAHAEAEHTGHGHEDHEKEPDSHAGHDHAAGNCQGADGGICPEHNVPEVVDALCQAGHISDLQPGQGMKVRLASPDVAGKAGIRTTKPQQVSLANGTSLHGRVIFDREKLAYITSLANGVIRKAHVHPGANVGKGDVLIEIAMPELSNLKAEFVTAIAQLEQFEAAYMREKDLLERGITSRQEFQQAEAEFLGVQNKVDKYRNQLVNFGLSKGDLNNLAHTRDANAVVALRAPFAGVVTDLQTAIGESVNAGKVLVTVADLDSLWLELSIPESRIYQAEVGSTIQARFDGLPGKVFTGRLFQVGSEVDERSRTLNALAEVANPGHRLKVGMFGTMQILAAEATTQLMIPADAVQSIDGLPYIFIWNESDLFELRRVETGTHQNGLLAVVAGLDLDDQVVVSQGFALKSEVLKARLGASCADH